MQSHEGATSVQIMRTRPNPVGILPRDLHGLLPRKTGLLWAVAICVAYVLSAELGFRLAFATKQVTAVWPPTGIALAAFLLCGESVWPGVFLGALLSNAMSHEPFATAAGIAVGNTLGPLAGAYL